MKKRYNKISKASATVFALLILLMSFPAGTAVAEDASENASQIINAGGCNPVEYPVTGELYKDRIAVSKEVVPADDENYFDVNLEIVAKPRVIDRSMDVVVVMDVSNTMNYTHEGLGKNDAGYNIREARLTHAKAAVSEFIDLYAGDTLISSDRNFALVTYNSYANTLIPLTDVSAGENAEELKAKVSEITASNDNRERFTNTEGGLQLAYNILSDSDSAFKYIIFVTDGYPSTYIEGDRESSEFLSGYDTCMSDDFNSENVGQDGYFADAVTGKVCSHGASYSDKAAEKAALIADKIKNSGINIFSVGIDVDEQSVDDMLRTSEKTAFTTVDRADEKLVTGGGTEEYIAWLENAISGGAMIEAAEENEIIHRYTPVSNSEELRTAFSDILTDMEILPSETMEEAYTLDYLSENVEFISFFDLSGQAVKQVVNTRNGSDVATYDPETNSVKWWLTATQKYHIDEIGNYVLSVSYRIRLRNEEPDFEYGKAYGISDSTTFYFKTVDFVTGEPLYGDNSIEYPSADVVGYSSDFTFINTDKETGKAIKGAQFLLEHYGDSCHICDGEASVAAFTATSDEQGVVSFEGLPSGHEYVLIQTKVPEGYAKGAYHSVHIDYGKVYFDGKEVSSAQPAVVQSGIYHPAAVTLSAFKTLSGRKLAAEEFTFVLEGEYINMFHEKVRNDSTGKAEFHEILFDEPGVYSFTVYEQQGTDSSVIYDTKAYSVEFTVTFIEGRGFDVKTKIDGEDVQNSTAPPAFEFESELRKPVTVSLEAEKLFDGAAPEDGVFSFELKDREGNVLQTKSTANGKIIFDGISYSQKGIYKYTLSEAHQCNAQSESDVFFDHNVFEAVVTVSAPAESDSFKAEVKYYLQGEEVEKVVFTNLTRGKASIVLNAAVTLDGEAPEAGAFSFEIREINGTLVERVQNDALGNVTFSPLEFSREGYFVFFITQVAGEDSSVTYCDTAYSVFVVSEMHHNLSSYYLDTMISEAQGDNFNKHIHLYGSELVLPVSSGVVFENISVKDATDFTEPDPTRPETEATDTSETTLATEPVPEPTAEVTLAGTEATPTDSVTSEASDATSATEKSPQAPDTVKTGGGLQAILFTGVAFIVLALAVVCILKKSKTS